MKPYKLKKRMQQKKVRIIETVGSLPNPNFPRKVFFNFEPTQGWAEIVWNDGKYGIKFYKINDQNH